MKRLLLPLAAATLAAVMVGRSEAQTRRPTFAERPVPGARQAEVHNPASPRYLDFQPGGYDRRMANLGRNISPPIGGSGGGASWIGPRYRYGVWYPYDWAYGYYGATSLYPYGGLYVGDYGFYPSVPSYYYGFVPPVYLPAGTMFGPRALRDFMGFDPPAAPQGNANAKAKPKANARPEANGLFDAGGAGGQAAEAARPRATNAESRAQAWRFIGFGDKYFGEGKYADAYQRYKKAAVASPDLAESYFRQGHALIAVGRYALASKAFQRGLALAPDWPASDFRYDQLYGANQADKAAHRLALAQAAAREPLDADLKFLLGVVDYFDGRPGQSRAYFLRAAELSIADASYLRGFLKRLVPPAPEPKEGLAEGER